MKFLRLILGLGVISWAVPFAVSVAIFPLKSTHAPLFDNLMAAVLTGLAVALGCRYLAAARPEHPGQAVAAGFAWWAVNVAFDLPLFSWGPMQRSLGSYLSDIGLAYCVYPIILAGLYAASAQVGATARIHPDATAGAGDSGRAAAATVP